MINRSRQGNLGEASAIDWLTRQGATVWTPLGHSPDADLIADFDGSLVRVQVKTSTHRTQTPNGHDRWTVALATNGGNQSWSRLAKTFDASRSDAVFVLTGGGRRWFLPATELESGLSISLGGGKYSEFEVDSADAIDRLVYAACEPPLDSDHSPGEYPSGQRMRAVNPWAQAFAGSNPASPILAEQSSANNGDTTRSERMLGRAGQVIVRPKRQTTIPKRPFLEAGLAVNDRLRVRADGVGRVIFERIDGPLELKLASD